jgi:hypothetical protein
LIHLVGPALRPPSLALDVQAAGAGREEQHSEQKPSRGDAAVTGGHLDDQRHADRGDQQG